MWAEMACVRGWWATAGGVWADLHEAVVIRLEGNAREPDDDRRGEANGGEDHRADHARAALLELLGLKASVEHSDRQQQQGHRLQPEALNADVLPVCVRRRYRIEHGCLACHLGSSGEQLEGGGREGGGGPTERDAGCRVPDAG